MTLESSVADSLDADQAPGRPVIVHAHGKAPEWIAGHRDALRTGLLEHGALLVRGLDVRDAHTVAVAARHLIDEPMAEREAFAPRREISPGVLSTMDWPADQPMCMHHELSYTLSVPRLVVMGCLTPAAEGGVTGLADARKVLADLPSGLVERFARDGWTLTRSFSDVIGLPWRDAFGVTDRVGAEEYCAANGISVDWQSDGSLRTAQRRPAVVTHPLTGEACWFNQLAFLNEWTMDPAVRGYLVGQFGRDGLPFNTRHGNGEDIDQATVDAVNAAYESATLREPWQAGDLLLVDNIRMAHSREPYRGSREICLVLGDPVRPVAVDARTWGGTTS